MTLVGAHKKSVDLHALEASRPPDVACDDDPLKFVDALGLVSSSESVNRRADPAMTTSELIQ